MLSPDDGLLSPVRLGPLLLPNRIVMAPMTRSRAGRKRVPTPLTAIYYAQRASAGLIITEATHVAPNGVGYPDTPGIHTSEQTRAWRAVTEAVHAKGGRIFVQLWHVGRVSHPSMQPDNELPVAPSAMAPLGQVFTDHGMREYVTPRALSVPEIGQLVQDFAVAAKLALQAGFDGVDLHAANGYLLDQFLRDGSNQRTDQYGGSIRNRARFLLEVVEAVSGVWGMDRVGVRLSPLNRYNTMHDSDPLGLSSYLASVLGHMNIGYLHVSEPGPGHPNASLAGCELLRVIRERFAGCLIVDGGRDRVSAEAAVSVAGADLVALATPFIANPDLVERLARELTLAIPDPDTFYTAGERGYTDYPTYPAELKPLPITGHSVPGRRAASPEAR